MTDMIDHSTARNPYVFVVGCPRSGTTLLRRLINAHPEIVIPKAETHWIPKFFRKGIGIGADGIVGPELLDALYAYPKFLKLGIERDVLEAILARRPRPTYPEFVSALFDHLAQQHAKRLAGDKTPGYVRFIPLLRELFPRARFLHLIRDGRDVALSVLSWSRLHKTAARISTFEGAPVATTALYWEWLVRLGREAGERLPAGMYEEMTYEALISDTEGSCRRICAFLGLPFEDRMLDFHAGRRRHGEALSAKKAWLPPTKGLRNWRADMSPDDIQTFEAASGELLDELGYARSGSEAPAGLQAETRRLRRAFDREPHPDAWRR